MAFQSQLLRGDSKLEAAAVSDPAHIVPGASGDHVRKIQLALIRLDGATIVPDGIYGPATTAAVLAYKQKRKIINRSYQTKADNIVGKMTMAALDREMQKWETLPHAPVRIKPLSYWRVRPPRSLALLALLHGSRPLGLNFAVGSGAIGAPNILPPGPNAVLEMLQSSTGSFVVTDGWPGEIKIEDPPIVKIQPNDGQMAPGDRFPIIPNGLLGENTERFKVFSGKTLGRTKITANAFGSTASLDVVVKKFLSPPRFTPGVDHAHTPSHRWSDVQARPNNAFGLIGLSLGLACKFKSPQGLVDLAIEQEFSDKPIAKEHLNWYLREGKGGDFVEDDNIEHWLRRDSGIRSRLKSEIFFHGSRKPRMEGHFTFDQAEFALDAAGQDFRFAFGSIDRVDFAVDLSDDTVRVWFQDRYEWHPVYPFYTFVGPSKDFPKSGDELRETNCLHAALVELKDSGAMDFWMKGEADVPLSLIVGP